MANYVAYYNIQVTDINGDSATTKIRVDPADTLTLATAAANCATLAADVQACTNGKVTSQSFTVEFVKAQISAGTAPPPIQATYPSVTDGARLEFVNSGGGKRSVTIPAPLLSDFKTGTNTVNPSDANIAQLITDIEGSPDLGGATNVYDGGVKTGRHARTRPTRKSL